MRHLSPFFKTNSLADLFFNDRDMWNDEFKNSTAFFTPRCDIEEFEDHFLTTLDLPGMKLEDIVIDLKDDFLVISGERNKKTETKKDGYTLYERNYGKFQRSFQLPKNVNVDAIEAEYSNGELHVLIPKQNVTTKKKIEVKNATEEGGLFNKILGKTGNKH